MRKRQNQLENQRGQAVVETVLLLAIIMIASLAITRFLEDSKFAQNLVGTPWNTLTGMIECGTWSGCARGMHPASPGRILSLKPDR